MGLESAAFKKKCVSIKINGNAVVIDGLDQAILWVLSKPAKDGVSIRSITERIRDKFPNQKVSLSTVRYRIIRMSGRAGLLRQIKKTGVKTSFYKLSPHGETAMKFIPNKIEDSEYCGIYSGGPYKPKETEKSITLMPLLTSQSLASPMMTPTALPAFQNLMGQLECMTAMRINKVFLCNLHWLITLIYTTHPLAGFKTWMMHRWLTHIDENTRYFKLSVKEMKDYGLNYNTRAMYKDLLCPNSTGAAISGISPDLVNRTNILAQFGLWHTVPFLGTKRPATLWDAFLKDVAPDIHQGLHLEQIDTVEFINSGVIPQRAYTHEKGNMITLAVALDIRSFYNFLKMWVGRADFTAFVNDRVRKNGTVRRPGRIISEGMLRMLMGTAGANIDETVKLYASNIEKARFGESLVQFGFPVLNNKGVCDV